MSSRNALPRRSAALARNVRPWRALGRVAAGLAVVSVTAGVLAPAGASLPLASVSMLVAVVAASLLGYAAALAAAVGGFLFLNYFFASPVGSLVVAHPDDLLVLVGFVAAAVVVSGVVGRLNVLRIRSERARQETQLRMELVERLSAGQDTGAVLREVARRLVALYDLASCTLKYGSISVTEQENRTGDDRPTTERLETQAGNLRASVELGRQLSADDTETIVALTSGLATALDMLRLEDEVRAERMSVELARSRAGFLTSVTHDLRTPLATIKAACAALLVEDSPLQQEERREMLESIYAETARLEDLVTKVLEIARARSGGLHPERTAVTADELLAGAVERVAPRAQLPIAIDVPSALPALSVDAAMIERVLVNLLENALRFAPAEEPIHTTVRSSSNGMELRVCDAGPGIPLADRERVFDEFVRLPTADGHGMGLGLAIVRALVAAHDGSVWCEETPGGGATFVVSLPLHVDQVSG